MVLRVVLPQRSLAGCQLPRGTGGYDMVSGGPGVQLPERWATQSSPKQARSA